MTSRFIRRPPRGEPRLEPPEPPPQCPECESTKGTGVDCLRCERHRQWVVEDAEARAYDRKRHS